MLETSLTRHGSAVVIYWGGRPREAFDVLLPDNTRGYVRQTDISDRTFRRRGPNKVWMHGELSIQSDEVVFVDGEQPVYVPERHGGEPNLEIELAGDVQFRNAMLDQAFALGVHNLLLLNEFIKYSGMLTWSVGVGRAARMVAGLHGRNECESDWKFGPIDYEGIHPDKTVYEAIIAHLWRLGWELKG